MKFYDTNYNPSEFYVTIKGEKICNSMLRPSINFTTCPTMQNIKGRRCLLGLKRGRLGKH